MLFVKEVHCVLCDVGHDLYAHKAFDLCPSCVPDNLGVNQGAVGQKLCSSK